MSASTPQQNPSPELIEFAGIGVKFLATADDSHGSLAMFELTVAGGKPIPAPAHSHDHYEETIYGLRGTLVWTVDGTPIEVGPGQSLCIRRGAVHRFDNRTPADAHALCIITPAMLGPQYFREIRDEIAAAKGAPPDKSRMIAIMRRHGLTPAPPPPPA